VLLFGGLLAGLLTSIVVRPVVGFAARRKASRAAARMRHAVENVGAELVLAGVQDVQRAYTEARAALRAAAGTPGVAPDHPVLASLARITPR
jgi:hypothetical protein